MIDRRGFLRTTAAGAASLAVPGFLRAADTPARRPNIIVILADDLGWGDLSCYPQDRSIPDARLRTPNIDSLAAEGARFTQGYATCTVCTPSRAGLMTGRYQQRMGWYEFIEARVGLPKGELTLADCLKRAGYATACIGKWHLGDTPELGPLRHGFDRFYGFLGGQHDFFDVCLGDPTTGFSFDHDACVLDQDKPVEKMDYFTEELTKHAIAFVDEQARAGKPFFLYLPYSAPHPPMQATWERLKPFADARGGKFTTRDICRAMIETMDDGIGQLLTRLMHLGIDDNTLIFFSSDNGGADDKDNQPLVQHNGGLRPRKGFLWEGGVRVPYIVRWPGHMPKGVVYDKPVSHLDIFATAIAAAGATGPDKPLDGVDLVPCLTGSKDRIPHETLYWGFNSEANRWAVRHGDWKLTRDIEDYKAQKLWPKGVVEELHNIATDPHERQNLADKHPEIVKQLTEMKEAFYRDLPPSIATPEVVKAWQDELKRRRDKLPEPDKLRRDGAPGHWL
jgi:arylsulfatase A-like enzyme